MVEKPLVLCASLCFIVNKFGNAQLNTLKSVVSDFYDVDIIVEAKSLLLEDVSKLSTAKDLPHIPKRRDGPNRLTRDVDDIISVLTFMDEQKLLNDLPRYVSDSPDKMPSIRLFDGDLLLLLTRLDKMEDKLVEFGSTLAAITADIHSGQASSTIPKVLSTL